MQRDEPGLLSRVKTRSAILAVLVLCIAGGCVSAHMASTPPSSLSQGKLSPCPSSPNCVCSQDTDAEHQISAFPLLGPADTAIARLEVVLAHQPRTKIVESSPTYLRAECRSRLFRFVDDVEFLVNAPAGVIEVRSASRVGHSDLGVNRRRVEALRAAWIAANPGTDVIKP